MDELETHELPEAIAPAASAALPEAQPVVPPVLPPSSAMEPDHKIAEPLQERSSILAIPIDLELVLATVRMPVSRLMDLAPGAEIDLDALSSGEVRLNANGALFAIGELFMLSVSERRVGLRIKRLSGVPL